jgi:hypothetical protein
MPDVTPKASGVGSWRRKLMFRKGLVSIAVAAAFGWSPASDAQVFDFGKYPDWSGQWDRADSGPPRYDPHKPGGRGQQAPLTPEYQANFEASIADMAAGGQGNLTTFRCLPTGMPRAMAGASPMEFIFTQGITYILFENTGTYQPRRIYTDGRNWPDEEPAFSGYSIGKWLDSTGSGRYDLLVVETRNMKGPRVYDTSGLPLHRDNQTIIRERIYRDKADPDLLHDEMTTFDHALTRPWTADKTFKRLRKVIWTDDNCNEGNRYVALGTEMYYVNADGHLMPVKKGQAVPDLRYFK